MMIIDLLNQSKNLIDEKQTIDDTCLLYFNDSTTICVCRLFTNEKRMYHCNDSVSLHTIKILIFKTLRLCMSSQDNQKNKLKLLLHLQEKAIKTL